MDPKPAKRKNNIRVTKICKTRVLGIPRMSQRLTKRTKVRATRAKLLTKSAQNKS